MFRIMGGKPPIVFTSSGQEVRRFGSFLLFLFEIYTCRAILGGSRGNAYGNSYFVGTLGRRWLTEERIAMKKLALIVASLGVTAASHAVLWNILSFPVGPVGVNASAYTTLGMSVVPLSLGVPANGSNAVTLLTPNGGVLGNSQIGQIFWEYEASAFSGHVNGVTYSIAGQVLGDGQVIWQEQVFGIDGVGNEHHLATQVGVINMGNTPSGIFGLNGIINLPAHQYAKLRVKKTFDLITGNSAGTNYASVGRINQACVPEPATMAALGLGLAALARRRRNR